MFRYTDGIPRRINTLCSRVLLYGAIEETHTITGPMVEATANELSQDLGAGLAAPQPLASVGPVNSPSAPPPAMANVDAMLRRIEALEHGAVKQEKMFRRVLDLLSTVTDR